MRQDGYVGNGIDVVEHNDQRYIVDGHHRAAAARRTGTTLMLMSLMILSIIRADTTL